MNPIALEWASILLAVLPQMLADTYTTCGLPCFVGVVNQLQLSAQMLDLLYGLPDGTASQFLMSNGFKVRGM